MDKAKERVLLRLLVKMLEQRGYKLAEMSNEEMAAMLDRIMEGKNG